MVIELNDNDYITLYSDMAEAFLNDTFKGQMHVIAANGDQSYTEPAQDRFNEICGLVTNVLDDNNIVQMDLEQQKKKEISIIKQDLKYLEKKLDYYIDYFLKEIKGVS